VQANVNVLLVDDVPANLLALEAMLDGLGHNLVCARSGQEALKLLLTREYAMILLDVEMPGMDGFETATFIRAREQTRHTPIIFLTAAQSSTAQIFRAYAVGAVDYMLKPLVPEILRSKVTSFADLAWKTQLVERQAGELERALRVEKQQAEELERKNVEIEQERQRVSEESRAKSIFLAGMSHELRTPLNAIIGFSDLLTTGNAGPLNARQQEFIGHVLVSGRHLLSLVNEILDLSKVEAGRMTLEREWTEIGPLIQAVRGVVVPLATKQGVELAVEIADDLPPAWCDPIRIKQVLYNLLSNGIKFTESGGRVCLVATCNATHIDIAVTDTGIGIDEKDLPRLFREFEQLRPVAGTKPGGTGLGLALTRRLLALHGGTVSVRSQAGIGSTFTAQLPIEDRSVSPVPVAEMPAEPGAQDLAIVRP
jgi:signal transduction histidine kinase